MLRPLNSENARRLRDFFAESGYTHERFQQNPALRELPVHPRSGPAPHESTAEPSALNTLLRWFLVNIPQTRDAVRKFVPEPILEIMLSCGVLTAGSGRLAGTVMLTPCDEFLFAADPAARMNSPESSDIVLWPNPTTRLLQLFCVRQPSRATLDLGAGCGILGVLAAAVSERVVATDINSRAEEFTLFNAGLNGVDNLEYRNGDTFEPVADSRFDLVLANPPFFVTPSYTELYCENQMDLDQYCRRVVREAPQYLNEGGFFQAVLEWVQVRGQSWQDRLAEWLEGSGCDAWVLRSYVRDTAGYARERIRETFAHASFRDRYEAWMCYYRERGVEEVHGGILALRKRSGRNWIRLEGTPVEATAPFGELVLETFATQDLLSSEPADGDLLEMKPRLPADAQLDQSFRLAGGKWAPGPFRIRLAGAAPAQSAVEREVARFLARCDGTLRLRELALDLSAQVKVDPETVRRQCCTVIRTLAARRIVHLSR
ncbi:MAG TPA: methyltransferase [Candidatus Acidoferrales bacterium]|nr:methyltransferase [Candidatus Acidoferrales bacterium]